MGRRLVLVHAHPDDESIFSGVLMAKAVADGDAVTLVTCTGGELGEIVHPDFEGLTPDELATQRRRELDDAMAILGVTDHRFLGGHGRYRDSGMKWAAEGLATVADDVDERSFWSADLDEAAAQLVAILNEVRAEIVVTYDPTGGYGHPDHVQAHRVAHRAAERADTEPEIWWITDAARADVTVSEPDLLDLKLAAMRAHVTQIGEPFFELHDDWGTEHFHRAQVG